MLLNIQKVETSAKAKKGTANKAIVKKSSAKTAKKKKINLRYVIDCTHPVEDGILDLEGFVSRLRRE